MSGSFNENEKIKRGKFIVAESIYKAKASLFTLLLGDSFESLWLIVVARKNFKFLADDF